MASSSLRLYDRTEEDIGLLKQRKEVARLLKKWIPIFHLDYYEVNFVFKDTIRETEESFVAAQTVVHTSTLTLWFTFSVDYFMSDIGKEKHSLEQLVVHEILHGVLWEHLLVDVEELINASRLPAEVKGHFLNKVESGAERVARILEYGIVRDE